MSSIQIVQGRQVDLSLKVSFLNSIEDEVLAYWAREYSGSAMFALLDGRPVGYLLQRTFSEVTAFYVDPKFRNQEIGTKLMQRAISIARSWGNGSLRLLVKSQNLNAIRLYDRLGFIRSSDDRIYEWHTGDKSAAFWMTLSFRDSSTKG